MKMDEKSSSHALINQEKWVVLTKKEVKCIFTYYLVIFVIALISIVCFIFYFSSVESIEVELGRIVVFAFINGLLGSTFYYIRKLYKICIQQLIIEKSEVTRIFPTLGAKIYFYFRPIMGATLSFLTILGIYGGFFILLDQPAINSDKFFAFVSVFSFLIGFSNGKVILKLDNSTGKVAEMINVHKENYDE